ncbi:hypothetical protein RB594_000907 [Gaeumannomyces avenae]
MAASCSAKGTWLASLCKPRGGLWLVERLGGGLVGKSEGFICYLCSLTYYYPSGPDTPYLPSISERQTEPFILNSFHFFLLCSSSLASARNLSTRPSFLSHRFVVQPTMDNRQCDLIIGIDFGTTGTAVAYAKPIDNKVRTLKSWPSTAADAKFDKVPSVVALKDRNVAAWGFGVDKLEMEDIYTTDYYKLFKPLICSQDDQEKREAETCVRMFLKELYGHLREQLEGELPQDKGWAKSKIKFLFSYPTTWDKVAKKRFDEQIRKAGYSDESGHEVELPLDEAAASMVQFLQDTNSDDLPKQNEHVLVADIGGGTSDIAIYKLGELHGRAAENIELVVCDQGNKNVGSTRIDERFKDQLRPMVEKKYRETLQKQQKQITDDDLTRLAEVAIFHLEHVDSYKFQKHKYGERSGRLQQPIFPLWLSGLSGDIPAVDGSEGVAKIPIEIRRDEFFKNPFDEQCEQVWEQCDAQLKNVTAINRVVLAGGLGSSAYVKTSLEAKFRSHPLSKNAKVTQIADPALAVCQGLVHDELRAIHGSPYWVYQAAARYGIQQGAEKNGIKWFLKHGDKPKVPNSVDITHDIDIDQNGRALHLDLKVVRIRQPPPPALRSRANWLHNVELEQDISSWVEKSLPGGLKRQLFSKKTELTIRATMWREAIVLTLHAASHPPAKQHGNPLHILVRWHADPAPRHSGAPGSSRWRLTAKQKSKLKEILAIAAGVATIASVGVAAVAYIRFEYYEKKKAAEEKKAAKEVGGGGGGGGGIGAPACGSEPNAAQGEVSNDPNGTEPAGPIEITPFEASSAGECGQDAAQDEVLEDPDSTEPADPIEVTTLEELPVGYGGPTEAQEGTFQDAISTEPADPTEELSAGDEEPNVAREKVLGDPNCIEMVDPAEAPDAGDGGPNVEQEEAPEGPNCTETVDPVEALPAGTASRTRYRGQASSDPNSTKLPSHFEALLADASWGCIRARDARRARSL